MVQSDLTSQRSTFWIPALKLHQCVSAFSEQTNEDGSEFPYEFPITIIIQFGWDYWEHIL